MWFLTCRVLSNISNIPNEMVQMYLNKQVCLRIHRLIDRCYECKCQDSLCKNPRHTVTFFLYYSVANLTSCKILFIIQSKVFLHPIQIFQNYKPQTRIQWHCSIVTFVIWSQGNQWFLIAWKRKYLGTCPYYYENVIFVSTNEPNQRRKKNCNRRVPPYNCLHFRPKQRPKTPEIGQLWDPGKPHFSWDPGTQRQPPGGPTREAIQSYSAVLQTDVEPKSRASGLAGFVRWFRTHPKNNSWHQIQSTPLSVWRSFF